MPRRLTAASGLNALAHCVEALYAPGANPVTDLLAQEGARQLAAALPVAADSPPDSEAALTARGEALYGTYLAGWSMEQAGTALHHTLCHVIGGTYRVDHGEVHAVLLPYVAAYNAHAAPAALALVALALGTPMPFSGCARWPSASTPRRISPRSGFPPTPSTRSPSGPSALSASATRGSRTRHPCVASSTTPMPGDRPTY